MTCFNTCKYIRTARTVSEVEFLVGFETEFILLTSTSPITTIHNLQGYSNSLALPTGSLAEKVLEEIVEALELSGIEVQMYHAEAAPGQVSPVQSKIMLS
jgi:glutamine synthetase